MTMTTIKTPSVRVYAGRTDGRTDADADICPLDTSIKTTVEHLLDHLHAGNVSSGQIRDVSNGQVYIFRVVFHDLPDRATRFERCVAWMRATGITNRAAFFEQCPDATESAALHHRCIRALVREGLIERIGREYVFKEIQ